MSYKNYTHTYEIKFVREGEEVKLEGKIIYNTNGEIWISYDTPIPGLSQTQFNLIGQMHQAHASLHRNFDELISVEIKKVSEKGNK